MSWTWNSCVFCSTLLFFDSSAHPVFNYVNIYHSLAICFLSMQRNVRWHLIPAQLSPKIFFTLQQPVLTLEMFKILFLVAVALVLQLVSLEPAPFPTVIPDVLHVKNTVDMFSRQCKHIGRTCGWTAINNRDGKLFIKNRQEQVKYVCLSNNLRNLSFHSCNCPEKTACKLSGEDVETNASKSFVYRCARI